MRTSIEVVQKGTEAPPTYWRLPDRMGGDNCLGPALGFHAYVLVTASRPGRRDLYHSLCRRETKLALGYGTRIGRPPVGMRCKVCDVEEQKLHMVWTPLPATEAAPDSNSRVPKPKTKGGPKS